MAEKLVHTFSIKPDDLAGQENVARLREHSAATGISFSYLILKAVDQHYKELGKK